MSIKTALKNVIIALGGNPTKGNIADLLDEFAEAKEPLFGLKVDAEIADSVDLLGKTASDLQEGITVGKDGKISGKLKYVTGYTGFSGDPDEQKGHYLALHVYVPDVEGVTIVYKGAQTVTLDPDGLHVIIVKNASKTFTFTASKDGHASVTKTFNLKGLKFDPVVE